jgi:hypothetical protein
MAKGIDGSSLTHFVLKNEDFKSNFAKVWQKINIYLNHIQKWYQKARIAPGLPVPTRS